MRISIYRILFPFVLCLIFSAKISASHIRAGEIIAENINNSALSWRFTLIMFSDLASPVQSDAVEFNFGDGSPGELVPRDSFVLLNSETGENRFIVDHTFNSAVGARFVISATEENRNSCIINFDNSVNSPFHIETEVVLDAALGINSTPRFTQIPVVNASVGQKWIFDNGGFDPDVNDSISYEWTIPKLTGGIDVLNYRDPVVVSGGLTEDGMAPAFLTLDPITGVLIWDAPNLIGCFNIAFKIVEWKQNPFTGEYIRRSTVTRDMQIIVDDIPNLRPLIKAPNDTCVVAGSPIRIRATAFDQDVPPDFLYLSASGEPFELSISPATYTPNSTDSLASPAALNFQWNTECVHVRKKPYRVIFRVDDARPLNIQLTDFGETNITVIGPGPILDTALIENNAIRLQWQPYTCSNAQNMKIYRRKGDFPYTIDSCLTGAPSGFEFIGQVNINTTTFLDDNDGEGLDKGPKYCYILVAEFPDLAESRPSNEKCNELPLNIPLITNVDVDVTNVNGRLNIRWTRPIDLDSVIYPPIYKYNLNSLPQLQLLFTSNELSDTSFVYNGQNTVDQSNSVNLDFFTADTIEQSSSNASSVFLETIPGGQRVQLNWSADVPWTNNGFYHLIYRESNNSGTFELLDSVFAENDLYSYLDQGKANGVPLVDGREYCYYIETRGSYFNSSFSDTLINRSQISCEIPRDSTAPCPPILRLDVPNCDSLYANKDCGSIVADLPNSNKLIWEPDLSDDCDTAIKEYNIYFKKLVDLPFELIDKVQVDTTFYIHNINTNLAGCYVVTAVDSFGNESEFSNEVCRDNCTYFSLPNTFSPNRDNYNNTFIPCPEPRFVKDLKFKVYNRWGSLVKEINDDPQINWDGLDADGNELPSGYYFYEAQVEFLRLNEDESRQTFKGWIWLVR